MARAPAAPQAARARRARQHVRARAAAHLRARVRAHDLRGATQVIQLRDAGLYGG